MAKLNLTAIGSRYGSVDALNSNFDAIEQAFQDVVYRDGSTPNYMEADLDMNGNTILNLSSLVVGGVNIDALNSALVWRGTWDSGTSYAVSDAVYYNGTSYICVTAHTNSVPPSASWNVLAAQGAAGAGTGDVLGPASSSTNNLATYANGTGKTLLDSGVAVSSLLVTSNLGSTVQAYDVDTAKTDVAQSFTAAQRGAVVALTDAANIATNMALANNFSVTLGGNRTLDNPTNQTAGQGGVIVITQDGTGSRTLAYGSNWKFPNGTAPTLTTTASAVDVLVYQVESASRITARVVNDVK